MLRKPPAAVKKLPVRMITQEELAELENLQRLSWQAHLDAANYANELRRRVDLGATMEGGQLYFDAELGMARSVKGEVKGKEQTG